MAYILTTNILPFILFADLSVFDAYALKDVKIKVPEAVRHGDTVTLSCDYDLESAALYTIKWYRDDEEFYRYIPKESPPVQVFPVPHLYVDVNRSNSKEVTLTDVERETSGEFKCEVSADAPLFHTDIRSAKLLVAEIPEGLPVLRTEMQKVAPGAKLRANCTTPGSYPKMNVTWYINDQEIHPWSPHVLIYESPFALPSGLLGVQSAMAVRAAPTLFLAGRLRLRCRARLLGLYDSSDQLDVQEDAPQLALVMVHDVTAGAQTARMTGSRMSLHLSHVMPLICLLGSLKIQ